MRTASCLLSLLALLLAVSAADAAETCTQVREVWTDGSGNGRTKSLGGTYLPVPIGDIGQGSRLVVRRLSGEIRYVTLHNRTSRGVWQVSYNGRETAFNHDSAPIAQCRNSGDCTHVVVQINGQHESYEPVAGRASVEICRQTGAAQHTAGHHATDQAGGEGAAGEWVEMPNNGMRIRIPAGWGHEIDDTAGLGNALFLSPDGLVAGGMAAMPLMAGGLGPTVATFEQSAFTGFERFRDDTAEVNGLPGQLRAYLMGEGENQMLAVAFYARQGDRFHVVWSLMPRILYESRSPETAGIMDSFMLRPPGPPSGTSLAGPPAAVIHFAVGERVDPGSGQLEGAASLFGSTADEIVAVFRLAGQPDGRVTLRLMHGSDGRIVSDGPVSLRPASPAGTALGVVRFPRPDDPWPLGLYELQLRQGEQLLARRLFFIRP